MIFDTHAHYDDRAFNEDRDELLKSLCNNNVEAVVNISADLKGCENTVLLTKKYPFIYGALGVHPEGILDLTDAKLEELKKLCFEEAYYNGGRIVAVGEIGLDYYYEDTNRDIQKDWFIKQIKMAKEVKLPIVIHSRDAANDTLVILKENQAEENGGIIHCYSYSADMAKIYLEMGYYFGIGGVVTFKNARKLVETVEFLPLDKIVLETDAPYLSPTPFRGKRNDSSNLKYVVEKISQIKHVSQEEVLRITNENARRVYRINANA